MRNKYRFTIITSLIAAVFILSLFSGIVAAQNSGEKNGNQENYANTEQQFKHAKDELDKAFKQFNAKKDSKSKADLVLKAQDYLEKAIDHTISYLDRLKSRVEKSENTGIIPFNVPNIIDTHVADLKQLKTKVQSHNTTKELSTDNQELKDIYAKIRLETRYYFAILLNNRTVTFIAKADNVTARLDAAISNLNNKSKDTSTLVAIRANFTNLMQQAAADQQNTEALLANHTGFDTTGIVTNITDAQAFLRQVDDSQKETINILKAASRQLQLFVQDYRRLSGGSAVTSEGIRENERNRKTLVTGSGTLIANGSGRAVIEGNVTVTLSGINGTLVVSRNAVVNTDAASNETLGNGQVKYQGFSTATITGDNIRVEISGNNIDLTASGTGAAILNGNGTYSTEKDFRVSGVWKKED